MLYVISIYIYIYMFILKVHVVLGFPWLQLLSHVSHDYSALTMEFWWQGQHHTLAGETSNLPTPVSLHQLQALVMGRDSSQLFELTSSPVIVPDTDFNDLDLSPDLPTLAADLLLKYQSLFQAPTGLSSHRAIDHRIHLVAGTQPVNVRPYRYLYYQKVKMEKLVRDMMQ